MTEQEQALATKIILLEAERQLDMLRKRQQQLQDERDDYVAAIRQCLTQNCHIADGDDCTLIGLKRVLKRYN